MFSAENDTCGFKVNKNGKVVRAMLTDTRATKTNETRMKRK